MVALNEIQTLEKLCFFNDEVSAYSIMKRAAKHYTIKINYGLSIKIGDHYVLQNGDPKMHLCPLRGIKNADFSAGILFNFRLIVSAQFERLLLLM